MNQTDKNHSDQPSSSREDNLDFLDLSILLDAVLKRLKLCLIICGTVVVLGLLYCFLSTPVYLAMSRMLVESGSLKVTQIQDVYQGEIGRDSNSRRDFIQTQITLMTSDHILARVYEKFNFASRPGFATSREPLKALSKLVEIKRVPNTNLIDIGFKDPDPKFSSDVTNYLVQEYINDARIRSTGFSEQGLEKLREELVQMEKQRFDAIERLNDFKSLHNMLSADTAEQLLVSKITGLHGQSVFARQQLANAEAAVAAIQTWKAQGLRLDSIPEAIANPTLTQFKVARLQAQATLVKTMQDFGPTHRTVATQRQVIAEMDRAISDETENSLISLQAKLEESRIRVQLLNEETEAAENQLKALDKISDEYRVLSDNLKAREKAYQLILDRVNELQIAKSADSGSGGTFQVIVPATPPQKAAYPQKLKIMVILCLGAGVLSVLLCVLLEMLDVTLKTREEFERRSELPVFGEIPFVDKKERLDFVSYDEPKGACAEAFRSLRTSLLLSPSSRKTNMFAVTSSVPHEGKSFISLNLAVTYARSGKRVLLIDADMRRRRLTQTLITGDHNATGLSNLLAGEFATSEVASIAVKPFEDLKLSFLACGPLPPNPTELLSAETSKGIFEELGTMYDMVIFDTAPMLLVSDTTNLAAVSGLKFLVVGRLFTTEKRQYETTFKLLRQAGASLLGSVIEQSDKKMEGYAYGTRRYGYSYGYGYGYGYGETLSHNHSTSPLTRLLNRVKSLKIRR